MIGLGLSIPQVAVRRRGVLPLDPLSLGARLYAWWDASNAASLSLTGAAVNSWTDRKNGLALAQTTAGAKPTWAAGGGSTGKPAVTFDGVDDYLTAESTGALPVGATPDEIILCATQADAVIGTGRRLITYGGTSGTTSRYVSRGVSGTVSASSGDGTTTSSVSGAGTYQGRAITRAQFDAGQIAIGFNTPALGAPTPFISATAALRTRIGASTGGTPGAFWQGPIEHIIVTGILTEAEAAGIFAFLQ